ncbi:NAD-dependent histone deacetylase SIR2 [Ceratobasidium sp. AG-Ba]|nr:NAD-dependent histone deacetylase SIR2 [Ceratobasidium sp. AG-Ba]QRW14235.1 NAD-dependent histone deacetylase SIR2 [Ceratobasidium sp. AG-Ba]
MIPCLSQDNPAHEPLYQHLQAMLAEARWITVVCGAGLSTSAGLLDYRSENGIYNLPPMELGSVVDPANLFDIRNLQVSSQLKAVGRVLALFRIKAKQAAPTRGHAYIQELHRTQRLRRCYTQNIDCMLTRGYPELMPFMLELHGRNELDVIAELDMLLLTKGIAECRRLDCAARGEGALQTEKQQLRTLPPGLLLPDIVWNQDSQDHSTGAIGLDKLLELDRRADLLLIIGTSISTQGAARLVRALAREVHARGGAVVYIGQGSLSWGAWSQSIDLMVDWDIDVWATKASQQSQAAPKRARGSTMRAQVNGLIAQLGLLDTRRFTLDDQMRRERLLVGNYSTPPCQSLMIFICHSGVLTLLCQALAAALMKLVSNGGHECRCFVVVLSGDRGPALTVPESRGHRLLVVHLSDQLVDTSGSSPKSSSHLYPDEMLRRSVELASNLVKRSLDAGLIIEYHANNTIGASSAVQLQGLFNRQTTFSYMVTSLNLTRWKGGPWAKFMLGLVNGGLGCGGGYMNQIINCWASNQELREHSGLVVYTLRDPATLVVMDNPPACLWESLCLPSKMFALAKEPNLTARPNTG